MTHLVTLDEARAQSLQRYYTGKSCSRGHVGERDTKTRRCCACIRIYSANRSQETKKWYHDNKEQHLAKCTSWAKRNRDRRRQICLKWQAENLDYHRANQQARRARKINAPGIYSAEDILAIGDNQKWRCVSCKKSIKKKYHVDHIQPLIKGGTNYPYNLQLLCPFCNISKGGKDPIQWAQHHGRLL